MLYCLLTNPKKQGCKIIILSHMVSKGKSSQSCLITGNKNVGFKGNNLTEVSVSFLGTHSSDSRSFISLFLSRKQPSECMLSSTSGSMSSVEGSMRIATFRGTGCSGSGSFFPPLNRRSKQEHVNNLVFLFIFH